MTATDVHLRLVPSLPGGMLGSRATAQPFRERLEAARKSGAHLVLDFGGHEATQGFVDELVGLLVLRHGRAVISQIEFRGCTSTVRGIVRFVLADRAAQWATSRNSKAVVAGGVTNRLANLPQPKDSSCVSRCPLGSSQDEDGVIQPALHQRDVHK